MKILQVNATDQKGGAGRAAYRLHRGLLDQGINSEMLVQFKNSNDPTVSTVYSNSIVGKIYSRLRPYANKLLQNAQITENPTVHSANFLPSGLHRRINNSDADIVHLHWLGAEIISVKELSKIKKPIIWTLHDMWAFSGNEHYDDLFYSGRYKEGYTKDNRPPVYKGFDIDRWTWKRKKKNWKDISFHLVTPSRWLAERTRESALLGSKEIRIIPNGLDTRTYKPVPKKWSRQILNITDDKSIKYILFGAMHATSNKRKGYSELKKALKILTFNERKKDYYELLVFGSEGFEPVDFGLPTTYLGNLDDDETLALTYSAADVMVVPSLQDNLPNTAVEATACGTPIVAFKVGGLSDIVDHKENGYLADPYQHEDFANGIQWVLKSEKRIEKLSKNARTKAVNRFSINKIANQYINVYKLILG